MKWYEIKYLRFFIFILFLLIIGNLSSQVFFLVTNSNLRDIIPEGQSYISFENNELEIVDRELTGDSIWELDSDEVYSGIYSIRSGEIDHEQSSTINITIAINNIIISLFICVTWKNRPIIIVR